MHLFVGIAPFPFFFLVSIFEIFLNFEKSNDNPESQLLLQMQGMIAE